VSFLSKFNCFLGCQKEDVCDHQGKDQRFHPVYQVSQEEENQAVNNSVLKHLKEHLTLLLHDP